MAAKRRLFVLGQPYVKNIRKAHESDEDIVRLCASHESLRVMEREAIEEVHKLRASTTFLRTELEKADRAALAVQEAPENVWAPARVVQTVPLDERPCRRLRRADGTCPCPGDRCWYLESCESLRRGHQPPPVDAWLGLVHRVDRTRKDER